MERVLSRFFNMETLDKKLLDENSWNTTVLILRTTETTCY